MADDHPVLREGLKQLFNWAGDIVVSGIAVNGQQVLECLLNDQHDILLLDMAMPAPSGVELIRQIGTLRYKLPILVLTMFNEPQMIKLALEAGAAAYLTKDSDPEKILATIRKLAQVNKTNQH